MEKEYDEMTNEEIQAQVIKEEYRYENMKDTIHDLQQRIDKAIEYIEEKEYVDYNPTLDGSEDDSYMELPRSLNLYNEELDILLDILKGRR